MIKAAAHIAAAPGPARARSASPRLVPGTAGRARGATQAGSAGGASTGIVPAPSERLGGGRGSRSTCCLPLWAPPDLETGPVATAVGDAVGLGSTALLVWNIAKWPVMLAVVVLIVALLYYATPNVKQPKFRWISVGAVVAILTWVVVSALFGFYVSNFSHYNKTYGSLAGVIAFLLWLWITNLALLFGGELDAELERGRELQAGQPSEET